MVKRTAARAKATLGHANVATTSGYLHACPGSSSGLKLIREYFPGAEVRERCSKIAPGVP
jgi:hypothetical protein